MIKCVELLKALCDGDEALFYEIADELNDQISFEVEEGIRQIDVDSALNLALELECGIYDEMLSLDETCQLLKKERSKASCTLVDSLLSRPGVKTGGHRCA